jgi:hemin uptake protein HemP
VQAMKPDDSGLPNAVRSTGRSAAAVATVRVVDSKMLFGGRREVQIRHNGAVYTLRETRQGKLILNK